MKSGSKETNESATVQIYALAALLLGSAMYIELFNR